MAAGRTLAGGSRSAALLRTSPFSTCSFLHPAAAAVLGGLASSSCCALQLALNAAGFAACAGFAALDPYRPLSMSLTALSLSLLHRRHGSWRVTAGAATVAAALTLLPLALAAAGRAGGVRGLLRTLLPAVAVAPAPTAVHSLAVRGMKCAACGERARAAAAGVAGVASAAVDWRAGTVSVEGDARPELLAAVEAALEEGGFEVEGSRDGGGEEL